jgi:hypothetical protein
MGIKMSNLEAIATNSYKNFHAKGLHYVCLERSPLCTLKAYFFEGEVINSPEIVVPHDHRYDFTTEVLSGELTDIEYAECFPCKGVPIAQTWEYRTPLNEGNGFTWVGEIGLVKSRNRTLKQGELLLTPYHRIHTIKVKRDTVLLLTQMQDKFTIERPTKAYSFGSKDQKPDTSGLYERFSIDEIKDKLEHLRQLGVAI